MSEETCGSCGAPGALWYCNGCGVEVCEGCCSATPDGRCDHCACDPDNDGWDEPGRWFDEGHPNEQPKP